MNWPNKAHALDGGIPPLFNIGRRWPAASDERRWCRNTRMTIDINLGLFGGFWLASMAFMRSQAPVIIAVLFVSLVAGCSKPTSTTPATSPTVTDLGMVHISDGIPTYHDLGNRRACVITPTVLKSNRVRVAIAIQETNSAGVVQTTARTSVDVLAGKPRSISVGDNRDIRFTPQIQQ